MLANIEGVYAINFELDLNFISFLFYVFTQLLCIDKVSIIFKYPNTSFL